MANPRLIPFRAEHLLMFLHRDSDYVESVSSAIMKESGPSFSIVYDDKVIGSTGVIIPWPGLGIAWAVFTNEISRFPVWMTRTTRRVLADIIRNHCLRRVEAVVLLNTVNIAWIEALGFTRENGYARNYTVSGADVIRYERIIK